MRSDSGEEMQIEVMTENEVVLQKFILLAESIFEMEEHDFVIEHEGKKNSLIHVYIKEPVYVTKILMTLKWCDEQFTQIEPVLCIRFWCRRSAVKSIYPRGVSCGGFNQRP